MKILMDINNEYKNKLIKDIEMAFESHSLPKENERNISFEPRNLETYLRLGLMR